MPQPAILPSELSAAQEAAVIDWIDESKSDGTCVTQAMVLSFAQRLHQISGEPGEDWMTSFLSRHPEVQSKLGAVESDPEPRKPPPRTRIEQRFDRERAKARAAGRVTLRDEREQGERIPAPIPVGEVIFEGPRQRIIRHDGNLVTKVFDGMAVDKNEAMAMRFVAENTTIPVPRVVDTDWDRITMTYVEGETLKMAWPVLTTAQRMAILDQLRGYIAQLRAVAWPAGGQPLIGRLSGEGAVVPGVITRTGGPFQTVPDLHDFLVKKGPSASQDQSMYWHQITQQLGQGNHKVVFSHGDLAARNIMVRDGRVVALLDWETAGWYPAYWDYYWAMSGLDNIDWNSLGIHIPSLFENRYDLEYILMGFVQRIN